MLHKRDSKRKTNENKKRDSKRKRKTNDKQEARGKGPKGK